MTEVKTCNILMICWGCWVGWARRHHALRVEIAYEKYTYMYMFYASLRALCLYNFNIDSQKLRYISKIARESSWIRVRNEFNTLQKGVGGRVQKVEFVIKFTFSFRFTHMRVILLCISLCVRVCVCECTWPAWPNKRQFFINLVRPPELSTPNSRRPITSHPLPLLIRRLTPLFFSLPHLCVPAILRLHLTFFSRNTL